MPLRPEPFDKDFLNHNPELDKPLSPMALDRMCEVETELRHDHPQYGPDNKWTCTLERGHPGRHEAHIGGGKIVASWGKRK